MCKIEKIFYTKNFKNRNLIHKISCQNYIGKTERIVGYRYKEHIYKPIPNAKIKDKNAPFKRSESTEHTIDFEGIEIISRADSNFKLCIKEKFNFPYDIYMYLTIKSL